MGVHGPDVKCPCRRCYACDGQGCDKCAGGIRCSKRGFGTGPGKWAPGLRMTRCSGTRTVNCKIDMGTTSDADS